MNFDVNQIYWSDDHDKWPMSLLVYLTRNHIRYASILSRIVDREQYFFDSSILFLIFCQLYFSSKGWKRWYTERSGAGIRYLGEFLLKGISLERYLEFLLKDILVNFSWKGEPPPLLHPMQTQMHELQHFKEWKKLRLILLDQNWLVNIRVCTPAQWLSYRKLMLKSDKKMQ